MVKFTNLEKDLVNVCCSPRRRRRVIQIFSCLREGTLKSPGSSLEGIQSILVQPHHHLLSVLMTEGEVKDCGNISLQPDFLPAISEHHTDEDVFDAKNEQLFAQMYELLVSHCKRVVGEGYFTVDMKKLQLPEGVIAGVIIYGVRGEPDPQQLIFLDPSISERSGIVLIWMAMQALSDYEDDETTDD